MGTYVNPLRIYVNYVHLCFTRVPIPCRQSLAIAFPWLQASREAAENLLEIESTIGARAAPECPSGPSPCAWSASRPRGYSCTCVPLLGLPPVHVVVMRAFEQFGGGGSRTCACCELQPCRIRSRDQCQLGSRLGRACEFACVHESVHPVVLPPCVDAYILSSHCMRSNRV